MERTAFPNAERLLSGLGHALDLLELLASKRQALPLAEIARSLGLSKAGVHRTLSTLTVRGYADRLSGGRYRLGIKAWELGCAVPELEIVKVAAPVMERLSRKTGDSVFLVALSGYGAVNLHSVTADQPVRVHVDLGSLIPANCTAGGLALLAALDDDELERVLPQKLTSFTPASIANRADLLLELKKIRSRGYAVNLGGWRMDVSGVGVAIPDASRRASAALNLAAPRYRLNRTHAHEMAAAVQAAAAEVAQLLASGRGESSLNKEIA